jgi:cobalt-zinc-cadmium efflux system membrane fusion protein
VELEDHSPTARGRAFLWGGIALGAVLVIGLLTRGFGLLGSRHAPEEHPLFVRQGNGIVIPQDSSLRQRLTVMRAESRTVKPKLSFPGVVESDPTRTAAVLTPLAGRIVEVQVALGDRVTHGQVLALIDSPDLAQAYDDDDKATDTLRLTSKNLERQEGQQKIGAASSRDLDQARSDHTQALAEYTRTQSRLKAIGASLDPDKRSRLLTVRAPFSGSITALAMAPSVMINDPTQSIATIADLSTVWVTALVPEKALAAIAKGQDAAVTLDAYPTEVFRGTVLFVSDVIEADSRRNKVRIAFANAHYALKPNMFTTVTLSGPQEVRVVLPTSALLMNNDRTSVFVATAPWTFERRIVDPQLEEGSTVTIRSGLAPGEQVVVKGGILLND